MHVYKPNFVLRLHYKLFGNYYKLTRQIGKMIGNLYCIIIVVCLVFSVVSSLDYDLYREGSCRGRRLRVPENINTTWMETGEMMYVPAGNRYNMLRTVSRPGNNIPEDQFYRKGCLRATVDFVNGEATAYTFGDVANIFDVRPVGYGILNFFGPRGNPSAELSMYTLTLTDNKSFAFYATCWTQSDQRGWQVLSNAGNLSPETRKLIEDHAVSLGYDKRQFVFLNYDRCPQINPNPHPIRRKTPAEALYGRKGRF